MDVFVYGDAHAAGRAAADRLSGWLTAAGVRAFVPAAGQSPLELYGLVAERKLPLSGLHVFALDEYVGVPVEESRTCANVLRRVVAEAWGIPAERFHTLDSRPEHAAASIRRHEEELARLGGIDVTVLGLGRNGHLGFNEPGSPLDSTGRVVDLTPTSVDANCRWFGGEYAPARGVTLGLGTLLAARHVLLVAFGTAKAEAVFQAVSRPPDLRCPASWLQRAADVHFYLDREASARLPEGS
jgi:glucosamine-6-phosphate deaminase